MWYLQHCWLMTWAAYLPDRPLVEGFGSRIACKEVRSILTKVLLLVVLVEPVLPRSIFPEAIGFTVTGNGALVPIDVLRCCMCSPESGCNTAGR